MTSWPVSTFFHTLQLYLETGNIKHSNLATCSRSQKLNFEYFTYITVPFHSICQSRITGPQKLMKCHDSHGYFGKVTKSFLDSKKKKIKKRWPPTNLVILRKKNHCLTKFCTCHAHLTHLTKPYFRQVHHASQWLTN